MNEALEAVSTSSAPVCDQMRSAVQGELGNAFRRILIKLCLEAKQAMVEARVAFGCDNYDVDSDVAQGATVFRNRLKKNNDVSWITEAWTDVSNEQGAGPISTPKS